MTLIKTLLVTSITNDYVQQRSCFSYQCLKSDKKRSDVLCKNDLKQSSLKIHAIGTVQTSKICFHVNALTEIFSYLPDRVVLL